MDISFLKTTIASLNVARLRIRWETVQVQVLSSAPNGNRRSLLPGKEARRPFFFFSAKVLSDEFKFQTLSNRDAHGEEIISLRMRGWPQGEEPCVLPLSMRLRERGDLLRQRNRKASLFLRMHPIAKDQTNPRPKRAQLPWVYRRGIALLGLFCCAWCQGSVPSSSPLADSLNSTASLSI